MIEVVHLFPRLNSSLITLLEGLSPGQWNSPTVCKKWSVKDIAAHLLDTVLRRISAGRDNHQINAPEISTYDDLLQFLNTLNADWVNAYRRISPQLLIRQMSAAQDEYYEHLLTLDLSGPALYPVAWAGEDHSKMWFDVAREYTERWHHQQQIRLAVGAESILDRELYYPFLGISMIALPFHYRSKAAAEGTIVRVDVVGEAGGSWAIIRKDNAWTFTDPGAEADAQVYIDQNIAWLLLSKGIDILEAQQYWQVAGDHELGSHALTMSAFIV